MAVLALTDAFCYVSVSDFTSQSNNLTLGVDVAQLDKTTFGSEGWQESAGGLKTLNFSMAGFWDSAFDSVSQSELASSGLLATQAYTFGPVETESSPAYMFQAKRGQYTAGGQIGELKAFSLGAHVANGVGVVRGQLAKSRGTVSATGALGSGVNLGAVSASQFLYATFHVFSIGTTITVQVQSDDNSGFTTPTTVATIGPLTAGGGTWMTPVAGALTDTWYRFNVSAITGSFSVAGAIGIA